MNNLYDLYVFSNNLGVLFTIIGVTLVVTLVPFIIVKFITKNKLSGKAAKIITIIIGIVAFIIFAVISSGVVKAMPIIIWCGIGYKLIKPKAVSIIGKDTILYDYASDYAFCIKNTDETKEDQKVMVLELINNDEVYDYKFVESFRERCTVDEFIENCKKKNYEGAEVYLESLKTNKKFIDFVEQKGKQKENTPSVTLPEKENSNVKELLIEEIKKDLEEKYPSYNAWSTPSNMADTMGGGGYALYVFQNEKRRVAALTNAEAKKELKLLKDKRENSNNSGV